MSPAFDLLVLGDANPDLVLRGGDVVPAFGQAERLVDEATLTVGGSGAIMACAAARLGLRVAFVGVVGDDTFGRYMRDELTARGVDTAGLVVDPGRPTGVTVVLSAPDDRAILTAPGTIAALRADLVDGSLLADARHVHVSSYFLQGSLTPGLPTLFEEVRRRGVTTSVDPNWDPSGDWDGGLLGLLPSVDVLLPNAMEATHLARTSDLDVAARALCVGGSVVVVKDGANGALLCPPQEEPRRIAARTVDAVDTTGAGDSFDAGFLASWLAGGSLDESVRFANGCGSLSTRASGGVDGQPTREEALSFLAEEVVT